MVKAKPGRRIPTAAHEQVTSAAAAAGLVLIDREGRYGGAPAALFKPLLRTIQRAVAVGDAAVVLSGAKLNVVVLALQKAIWVEEEVVPRDLYAFSALNDRTRTPDQRLRRVAERLLARPDRKREGRSSSYPSRRIVAEYAPSPVRAPATRRRTCRDSRAAWRVRRRPSSPSVCR